jgi:hypothetical protein
MGKMIAYMATWTTCGTWLQGDKRGYVKESKILPGNDKLKSANQKQQKFQTVKLNAKQRQIVEQAVGGYKYSATSALRNCGVKNKIWSGGFDERFCFT